MRKIDDETLLAMIADGKEQKEAAAYFSVSPAAICKRLKRLQSSSLVILDKHNLTEKEKTFVMEKARGKTNTQAALVSYEAGSIQSAKVIGSQLMSKPEIRCAVDELLEQKGIGREFRVNKLGQHMNHADPVVSLKALDMGFKLSGDEDAAKHTAPAPQMTFVKIDLGQFNRVYGPCINCEHCKTCTTNGEKK
jgi:hypothetical protein